MSVAHTIATRHSRDLSRLLIASCLLVVVGQRIALPLGSLQLPVTAIGLWGVTTWALGRGVVMLSPPTVLKYLGVVVVALVCCLAQSFDAIRFEVSSVAFLVFLYGPVCFRLVARNPLAAYRQLLGYFVDLMTVFGAFGALLFCLQFVGVPYRDWLSFVLPSRFLVSGYATSYEVVYGSGIYRSNGVVFLEPSFFSIFLGLGILAALQLGRRSVPLVLMTCALVTTVSGNGLALVAIGLLVMTAMGQARRVLPLAIPVVVAVVLAVSTPLGGALAVRIGESSNADSSTSLRLIVPYRVLIPEVAGNAETLWRGHGAGSADSFVAAWQKDLIAPVPVKLLYEYGLLFSVVFLVFLTSATIVSARLCFPVLIPLLMIYCFLNAGLLISPLVGLLVLFGSIWSRVGLVPPVEDGPT